MLVRLYDIVCKLIYLSVTAVGGTIHVPEVAVSFSGGGFSNVVRARIYVLRLACCNNDTPFSLLAHLIRMLRSVAS